MGSSGKEGLPSTEETYTHLSKEDAKRIFETQAVFHPERDVRCVFGKNGSEITATFNPRSCVRRNIPKEAFIIEQMAKADKVVVFSNPDKQPHR